jgi:hypothetical protein
MNDAGFTLICLLQDIHPNQQIRYTTQFTPKDITNHSTNIKQQIHNELLQNQAYLNQLSNLLKI